MIELGLYIVLFIVFSGLMALIEAAILSVSPAEVEELVQRKKPGAAALQSIVRRISRAVVILVLFTNTINVLGPILAGNKAIEIYGESIIGVITAVLTFGTILFSEIIPKSLGAHYAPLIARHAAPIVLALIYGLYPLVVALEWVVNRFKSGERAIGTEAQIRSLTAIGKRAGHIESDEGQLINRAFLLNDKTAADIMTPIEEVTYVRPGATIKESAERVFRTAYSRYPILDIENDAIEGMVLSHDILAALSEGQDGESITTITRPTLTIRAEMRLDRLLYLFRDRRIHLAVVHNGRRIVGLVTLEDVLEELVGDIEDEKDTAANKTPGAE